VAVRLRPSNGRLDMAGTVDRRHVAELERPAIPVRRDRGLCIHVGWVRVNRLVMAAFAGLCLCLAYWFWSAPDVRFGSGYLATAGILGLSIACAACFPTRSLPKLTLEAVAVSALLGISSLVQSGNTWTIKSRPAFAMRTAPAGNRFGSRWETMRVAATAGTTHSLHPVFLPERLKRIRWR